MLRNVSLEEISDGRLYGGNDMVRAGCDDCRGCSACCHGMGASIVLDPLDLHHLTEGLETTAQQLLTDRIELNVADGIILPNIRMTGETEQCPFLNAAGRCEVHAFRPGICRLFPLGRYYDGDGGFRYFLQTKECRKKTRTKVKVFKWIGVSEPERYERFAADWHYFLKSLQDKLNQDNARQISMYVLQWFYLTPYPNGEEDGFYGEFYRRLEEGKRWRESL